MKPFVSFSLRGKCVLSFSGGSRYVRDISKHAMSTMSSVSSGSQPTSQSPQTASRFSLFNEAFVFNNGNSKAAVKDRLLVFYDGGCPLCATEIAFYDSLNRSTMGRIAFINLETMSSLKSASTITEHAPSNTSPLSHLHDVTTAYSINIPDAYRRLHAISEDGSVHKGAPALCEIWQRLPYWWGLDMFVRKIPGVLPLTSTLYEFFAARRIKWRQSLSSDIACSMRKNKI